MYLEQKLEENTKALNRLSDLMEKGGGAAATTGAATTTAKTTGTTTKAAGGAKATKPKNTAEQVKAAVFSVKDHANLGPEHAKELIEEVGGAGTNLAGLLGMPDKFDEAVAKAEQMVTAAAEEPTADDNGGL